MAEKNVCPHLQVRGAEHSAVRLSTLACQGREDVIEHAETTPTNEAIIERLVRPVILGSILEAGRYASSGPDSSSVARRCNLLT